MLPSDPWDHDSPGGPSSPCREDALSASSVPVSIDRLAVLLSPQSREGTPAELARDLQLNQLVEQACLATGATGAAIALARGDEFICRASTGTTAPDLGMRLNIDQGLSAFCVHTGEVQRCDDSEFDARVDAEVCRHLGVRSVLVVPIVYGDFFLGIFEVFSPQPYAFYDRDIQAVMALSRSVLAALGISAPASGVTSTAPRKPTPQENSYPVDDAAQKRGHADSWFPSEAVSLSGSAAQMEATQESSVRSAAREGPKVLGQETPSDVSGMATHSAAEEFYPEFKIVQKPPRDYWTGFLTILVIALALLLGWMLGHGHLARRNAAKEELEAAVAAQQKTIVAETASPDGRDQVQAIDLPSAPAASTNKSAKTPPDGLVVYQDGKIIFRQGVAPRPATAGKDGRAASSSSQPVELDPEVAGTLLTHRVEPHYPDRARRQKIQGPVILQALINEDGSVRQLKVLTGNSDLAVAAIDAVRHWRFRPFTPKGKPSQFATQIRVNFALPSAQQ
jgi:TonB family protein